MLLLTPGLIPVFRPPACRVPGISVTNLCTASTTISSRSRPPGPISTWGADTWGRAATGKAAGPGWVRHSLPTGLGKLTDSLLPPEIACRKPYCCSMKNQATPRTSKGACRATSIRMIGPAQLGSLPDPAKPLSRSPAPKEPGPSSGMDTSIRLGLKNIPAQKAFPRPSVLWPMARLVLWRN